MGVKSWDQRPRLYSINPSSSDQSPNFSWLQNDIENNNDDNNNNNNNNHNNNNNNNNNNNKNNNNNTTGGGAHVNT